MTHICSRMLMIVYLYAALAVAGVDPLIQTEWGQGAPYNAKTPVLDGEHTYPGCTSIALAQVLRYYRYLDHGFGEVHYSFDNANVGTGEAYLNFAGKTYDFAKMPFTLDGATAAETDETTTFIYHVAVALNAQFDLGLGSAATARQLENAAKYNFGFRNKSRRDQFIALKETADGYKLYGDEEWEQIIRAELEANRPVIHMAKNQNGDGHVFIIDGYNDAGLYHINWGWGGHANGYYALDNLQPEGSDSVWGYEPMIYIGFEPDYGFAQAMRPETDQPAPEPSPTPVTDSHSGVVSANQWVHFGPYEVAAGDIQVSLTGSGDADLYVRWGAAPTQDQYDARPYLESSQESVTLTGAGACYVAVNGYADSSNYQMNVTYLPQTGPQPEPPPEGVDLVVENVVLDKSTALPNQVIAVTCDVRNLGSQASVPGRMKYYLSTDALYDSGDKYLNYDNVGAIAAGESGSENANLRIPSSWASGDYYLLFVADITATNNEIDETNNVAAVAIEVQ